MVRHHAQGVKKVAIAVEELQRVKDYRCHCSINHVRSTTPEVEQLLNLPATLPRDLDGERVK
jgi:hypothetical protein